MFERHNGDLLRLGAFFGPQHGFLGQTQDNMVEWKSYEHPRLHIPVYSLYGEHREPTAEMLNGLDVLVVDLQDIGSRYYTFIWTLYLCMRACERCGTAVVVFDRPNPINGVTTEGPTLNPNYKSFVGMHPLPIRHGRTIGELAQQFRDEAFPTCELSVLSSEKLGSRNVVRPNRPAMGDALTEYADPRHRHGLPRDVSARRHQHFRRTRHDATV